MLFFALSCREKVENRVNVVFDPESMPSMVTNSVEKLISDSGITRYRIVADVWKIFDRAKEPYWICPEGFYLERFDKELNIEATIKSDTAWFYIDKKLWRLKGHVDIRNMENHEFRTEELFWNQTEARFYSDRYIEIKRGELELKGYGFESNQEMTDYRIRKPHDGKLPFEEEEPRAEPPMDVKPDSL